MTVNLTILTGLFSEFRGIRMAVSFELADTANMNRRIKLRCLLDATGTVMIFERLLVRSEQDVGVCDRSVDHRFGIPPFGL